MRCPRLCVLVVISFFVARDAKAQTTNLELAWEAPAGCATRGEIADRVGRLIGTAARPRQAVRAHAVVTKSSDGLTYRADLDLASGGEPSAHRVLEGDSCPAVADALVTIMALAIDPEATIPGPSTPPAPRPAPPAPPPPPPPAPRLRFLLGAAARLDVGSLPKAVFGGQAIIGATYGGLGLEVDGSLLAPASATLDGRADQGADIKTREIGGRFSYALSFGSFEVGPRVGLHGRWFFADGFGAVQPTNGSTFLAELSFGALAKMHLGSHFALRAGADVGIPIARPTFIIDSATVYEVGAANVAFTLGADLEL